jgi:hypothetical protein
MPDNEWFADGVQIQSTDGDWFADGVQTKGVEAAPPSGDFETFWLPKRHQIIGGGIT